MLFKLVDMLLRMLVLAGFIVGAVAAPTGASMVICFSIVLFWMPLVFLSILDVVRHGEPDE